eukprot:2958302-Pyramimonas_sp.AAC.1
MPHWRCLHAFPSPSKALRGPIGNPTEGSNGGVRMRLLHPVRGQLSLSPRLGKGAGRSFQSAKGRG